MLRRYRHIIAYLLLVFLPLQAFAAANMLVCHGMMQAKNPMPALEAQTKMQVEVLDDNVMPCHSHKASKHVQPHQPYQSACQSGCASACVSICAMVALTVNITAVTFFDVSLIPDIAYSNYVSITLPNPHRPPISII